MIALKIILVSNLNHNLLETTRELDSKLLIKKVSVNKLVRE